MGMAKKSIQISWLPKPEAFNSFFLTLIVFTTLLTAPSFSQTKLSLHAQADSLWAQRANPAMARKALQAYIQAAQAEPENIELWTRLARANCLVGYYIETDANNRDAILQNGMEAAKHALLRCRGFKEEYQKSESEKKAATVTEKEGLPALFWYAANLGRWAQDKNLFTQLRNKSTLEAFYQRILDLDETLLYGAPHRFFGVLPCKVPGGKLSESKPHFEKAIAIAPNYLGTYVLYAETYAVKAKDKNLFIANLNHVIQASPDLLPDMAAENRFEQANAKILLGKIKELFPD